MTSDLEITRACAKMMGIECNSKSQLARISAQGYDPLHDDAQCFALIGKFGLRLSVSNCLWTVIAGLTAEQTVIAKGASTDLKRAICECIANLAASGQ